MVKTQKSPGVDNVLAELIKHGGEAMIDAFMIICQQIWENQDLARNEYKTAYNNDTIERETMLL